MDFDGAIFDPKAVDNCIEEHAWAYGISPASFNRILRLVQNAEAMGIRPAIIFRLPEGSGCRLELFGPTYFFIITVAGNPPTLMLSFAPVDSPDEPAHLLETVDSDHGASRILRRIAEKENVGFFDGYWAQEHQRGLDQDD